MFIYKSYLCYLTGHWEANNFEVIHGIDKSLGNITERNILRKFKLSYKH